MLDFKPTIDKIEQLVKAVKPLDTITPFPDRPHQKLVVRWDGVYQPLERPRALRQHTFDRPHALRQFIAWALGQNSEEEGSVELKPLLNCVNPDANCVMISERFVDYRFDANDREHSAVVPLAPSAAKRFIDDLDDDGFDQADLVDALRIDLKDAHDGKLLAAARGLKWTRDTAAEGTVGDQGSSFSRAVTNRVQGVEQLPADFSIVGVSLFDNFHCPVSIDFAVTPRVEKCTIVLRPYPESLRRAKDATFAEIAKVFDGVCPAFAGSW